MREIMNSGLCKHCKIEVLENISLKSYQIYISVNKALFLKFYLSCSCMSMCVMSLYLCVYVSI